ncbi:hypothetical protein ACERII_20460 [Evansella sp. AB-rgal1]
MKKLVKGVSIGVGLVSAIYAAGLWKDYKEKIQLEKERATFGTGQ